MTSARFSMTKILLSALAVGLFFSAILLGIQNIAVNYDMSDVNQSSFEQFANYTEINEEYADISNESLNTQADQGAFDVLGNLVSKALSPFKGAINGVKLGKDTVVAQINFLGDFLGVDLGLYIQYFLTSISIIIGLYLLFKILFKTDDGV